MTELEHLFLGILVLIILYFLFFKDNFVSQKAVKEWEEKIKEYF